MGRNKTITIIIHCELVIWQQENSEIQSESAIMWKVQHVYIPLIRDEKMWLMANISSVWLEDQSKY